MKLDPDLTLDLPDYELVFRTWATLDLAFNQILRQHLGRNRHTGFNRFTQKVRALFDLGLITGQQTHDLTAINRIRNRMAHLPEQNDFSNENVIRHCRKLSTFEDDSRVAYLEAFGQIIEALLRNNPSR